MKNGKKKASKKIFVVHISLEVTMSITQLNDVNNF